MEKLVSKKARRRVAYYLNIGIFPHSLLTYSCGIPLTRLFLYALPFYLLPTP